MRFPTPWSFTQTDLNEAREILAEANKGESVIARESDGKIFISLDVASGTIAMLLAKMDAKP